MAKNLHHVKYLLQSYVQVICIICISHYITENNEYYVILPNKCRISNGSFTLTSYLECAGACRIFQIGGGEGQA